MNPFDIQARDAGMKRQCETTGHSLLEQKMGQGKRSRVNQVFGIMGGGLGGEEGPWSGTSVCATHPISELV